MTTFVNVNVSRKPTYIIPGRGYENVVFNNFTASQALTVYLPLATPVISGSTVRLMLNDSTFNENSATMDITTQRNQKMDGVVNKTVSFTGDGTTSTNLQSPWIEFYTDGMSWFSNSNPAPTPPTPSSKVYTTIDLSGIVSPLIEYDGQSYINKDLTDSSGNDVVYQIKNFQNVTGILDGSGNQINGYILTLPTTVGMNNKTARLTCIDSSNSNISAYACWISSLSGETLQWSSYTTQIYNTPFVSSSPSLRSIEFEAIEPTSNWIPISYVQQQ